MAEEEERKRADRAQRFRHHAGDFAFKLIGATIAERCEAIDYLHSMLKFSDAAEADFTPDEQDQFDADMQKPLCERSGHWNYRDDPALLSNRAASLMREAGDLAAEAQKLLLEAARIVAIAKDVVESPAKPW